MNATTLPAGRKMFDDRLSPILVKELRQGLRARVFVLSFFFLQVFLSLLVLANLEAQGDYNTLNSQNWFFWVIAGFALLVLMPIRGLVAISQEVRRNTIETIMLTRMTAWRVVFGKWSALFAQSFLFVTAMLPYIVLRYFIGGDDVVSDFEWLLFMLWGSALLIAASIGISALGNLIVRILSGGVAVWLLLFGGSDFYREVLDHGSFLESLAWLLVLGGFVLALVFQLAASAIAPASENHAVWRRLLAVGFFVSVSILTWVTGNTEEICVILPLSVLAAVCYVELSEKPRLLVRLVQPLRRVGWLGKLVGLFFLPGWPSGLLFTLVVLPLAFVGLAFADSTSSFLGSFDSELKIPILAFSILGSVLVPILLCHLVLPKANQVLLLVVLYNIILSGVAGILTGFAQLTNSHFDRILSFVPSLPSFLVVLGGKSDPTVAIWYFIDNAIVLAGLLVLLFVASRSYFRGLVKLIRDADEASLAAKIAPPSA